MPFPNHGRTFRMTANIHDPHPASHPGPDLSQAGETSNDTRRLRALLDLSDDGFVVLGAVRDSAGTIVDFNWVDTNEAACRLLGTSRDGLFAHTLLSLLPDHTDPDGLFEKYCRVVETGLPHEIELHFTQGAYEGWWRNSARKFDDGVIVRFSNISRQRRADVDSWRLSAIVEQSSDFIGIASVDGDVEFINEAGIAMVGLPDQAALRQTRIIDYFMPSSQDRVRNEALVAVERDGFWQAEMEFRHFVTGHAIPVLYNIFPVRDATGRTIAYATVTRNFSEIRQAHDALRESEAKFRAIADAMPQMVWSTQPDGLHDYYNARWYEFTGVPEGSTDGEGWNDMFHPDDQERAWSMWRHCLETGAPYEIEYRLRHHSGEYRWTLGRALPIRDDSGAITRWFGTCTDIHEAKSSRRRLEDTQVRLQLALSAASIGVWEYDLATGIVVWDDRVREAAGHGGTDTTYYKDHFLSLVHPQDRAMVDEAIHRTAQDGRELNIEYRIRRPGGANMHVASAARRIIDADGGIRVIGTALDVTEPRLALAEREMVAQELSHRIKNIFSVMSGIIGLSARAYPEIRPLADQLRARIAALGRAHDFVRPHQSSRGSTAAPTLQALARELFEPYVSTENTPVIISGDDVAVDDRAATPLALLFHELATNASKYGALMHGEGRVELSIKDAGDTVVMMWSETGGPAIDGVPSRQGFGTRLTTLSVETQLGGRIAHHWERSGLQCRIEIPATSLTRED
jgi:PAS domain S-box-containing protein